MASATVRCASTWSGPSARQPHHKNGELRQISSGSTPHHQPIDVIVTENTPWRPFSGHLRPRCGHLATARSASAHFAFCLNRSVPNERDSARLQFHILRIKSMIHRMRNALRARSARESRPSRFRLLNPTTVTAIGPFASTRDPINNRSTARQSESSFPPG